MKYIDMLQDDNYIKKYFNFDNNSKLTLDYLGDKDAIFWNNITLVYLVGELAINSINDLLRSPTFTLRNKFINHTVACYTMLLYHLENEAIILYRQMLEAQWALKHFIENPEKVEDWIQDEGKYVGIKAMRESVDGNTHTRSLYQYLSNYSHPFPPSRAQSTLGGLFIESFTDNTYLHLLISMGKMIEYFYEIINKYKNTAEPTKKKSYSNEFEEALSISYDRYNSLNKYIILFSYYEKPDRVIEILNKNGDIEMIKYLESINMDNE